MHILFLSAWFPFPPDNGSKLRIYHLLEGLSREHQVTLISFAEETEAESGGRKGLQFCNKVITIARPVFQRNSLRARLGLLSLRPRSVVDTFSPEMARTIQTTLTEGGYDLVIASQTMMAGYYRYFGDVPAVFEEVEIALLYEQYSEATTWRERARRWLMWWKHRHYLRTVLGEYEAATVASEAERALIKRTVKPNTSLTVIPNCIERQRYEGIQTELRPNSLIFTGSFRYHVNYEAMVWFLKEVYPRVQQEIPEIELTITGDHADLPLPNTSNVTLTGYVDDIRPLVAGTQVSLAPLLQGGGTRLKILEAMALGTPVVATSKGAEGLHATNGEEIVIADSAEEFASAITRICRDPDLRHCLATNGVRFVRAHYDWERVIPDFLQLAHEAAGNGHLTAQPLITHV